jgi:hypothetical protein
LKRGIFELFWVDVSVLLFNILNRLTNVCVWRSCHTDCTGLLNAFECGNRKKHNEEQNPPLSANCMWLERLYAQENKFDAWTADIKLTLKPCRVKFYALFGLSTYTGRQRGSSRWCRSVGISDNQLLTKSLGCWYIWHSPLKINKVKRYQCLEGTYLPYNMTSQPKRPIFVLNAMTSLT